MDNFESKMAEIFGHFRTKIESKLTKNLNSWSKQPVFGGKKIICGENDQFRAKIVIFFKLLF